MNKALTEIEEVKVNNLTEKEEKINQKHFENEFYNKIISKIEKS